MNKVNRSKFNDDVRAAVEGHLEVNLDDIVSRNGMELDVVVSEVPEDWAEEVITGVHFAVATALADNGEPQSPSISDLVLERMRIDDGVDILRIEFKFMLCIVPPALNLN